MAFPSIHSASRRLCAIVIGLAALGLVLPLSANEDENRVRAAKSHYASGDQAFKEGHYERALREFEAGYQAIPRPAFLLNMGHCQRRLGDPRQARELYRLFLEAEPHSPLRAEVESVMAELQNEMPAQRAPAPRLAWRESPAATSSSPALDMQATPAPRPAPLYARWQTWAVVAGLVAVGASSFLLLHNSGPSYTERGTLGTMGAP